jgi:Ca2+-binding EF-hand superfamily protein
MRPPLPWRDAPRSACSCFPKFRCGYAELRNLDHGFRAKLAKNGRISKYDFSLLFQKMGLVEGQFIDRLYIAAGKQSNGELRPQDIITSVALLVPGEQEELLALLFDLWDRDQDGSLTEAEFCQFYDYVRNSDPNSYSQLVSSSEREPFKPENLMRQAQKAFQNADTNGDGKIDKTAFLSAFGTDADVHLDSAFFERVRDPTRCGQLFAPYTLAQRTLLKLLGKKQVYFENEELPPSVLGDEGKYDVFYVVLSGRVHRVPQPHRHVSLPIQQSHCHTCPSPAFPPQPPHPTHLYTRRHVHVYAYMYMRACTCVCVLCV